MSETPKLEVVQLRDGAPSLRDQAAWLRRLADQLERADVSDVRTILVVSETVEGKVPAPWCFGDNPDRSGIVGLLTRATHKAVDWGWDTV